MKTIFCFFLLLLPFILKCQDYGDRIYWENRYWDGHFDKEDSVHSKILKFIKEKEGSLSVNYNPNGSYRYKIFGDDSAFFPEKGIYRFELASAHPNHYLFIKNDSIHFVRDYSRDNLIKIIFDYISNINNEINTKKYAMHFHEFLKSREEHEKMLNLEPGPLEKPMDSLKNDSSEN